VIFPDVSIFNIINEFIVQIVDESGSRMGKLSIKDMCVRIIRSEDIFNYELQIMNVNIGDQSS